MITEKDIKPIPKYIVKRIKQLDKKQNPNYSSVRRFYSYLTKFNGELAKVTVAVKEHYKDWYIKHCSGEDTIDGFIITYLGVKFKIEFNLTKVNKTSLATEPAFKIYCIS